MLPELKSGMCTSIPSDVISTATKSTSASTYHSDSDCDVHLVSRESKSMFGCLWQSHQQRQQQPQLQQQPPGPEMARRDTKTLFGFKIPLQGLALGILLVIAVGLQRKFCAPCNPSRQGEVHIQEDRLEDLSQDHRPFLKPGSIYQNSMTSLYSATGVPISVTLKVKDSDCFELKVQNLNSKGRGSKGWFKVRGAIKLDMQVGASDLRLIKPEARQGVEVFSYDASILDSATAFAFRCLQKVSSGVLYAVKLEVDPKEDAILVTPRAQVIRMLWAAPVVLRLTSEADMWNGDNPSLRQSEEGLVAGQPQTGQPHAIRATPLMQVFCRMPALRISAFFIPLVLLVTKYLRRRRRCRSLTKRCQ